MKEGIANVGTSLPQLHCILTPSKASTETRGPECGGASGIRRGPRKRLGARRWMRIPEPMGLVSVDQFKMRKAGWWDWFLLCGPVVRNYCGYPGIKLLDSSCSRPHPLLAPTHLFSSNNHRTSLPTTIVISCPFLHA